MIFGSRGLCYSSIVSRLELEMTAGLEPVLRVHSLRSKLVDEGRKYIGSENYFPLGQFSFVLT